MNGPSYRRRIPLMALALLALLAGMWAGLLRLSWTWPVLRPTLPVAHGPLMVSGFLGTLIGLERAVALGRRWTYVGPLFTGLGAVLLIFGVAGSLGPLLITLGSLVLVAAFVVIVRRHPALFTVTMALGALVWLVGNALWLARRPIPLVVLWWAGFLVLTIVGERLELSRLLRLSRISYATFLLATGLYLAGLVLTDANLDGGTRLAGVGMLALTAWLLRYDIARRTVRQSGLARFTAVCLLSGYVWLGIAGMLALRFGGMLAGPRYDAMLHSLFLGFVFAMIFGHAPIIFPAVLGLPITFRSAFYGHLVLLHLSLALRVSGDLLLWWPARQWGGLLNVVVVLLFLANTANAARHPATREIPAGV
jgi:hypothetical protein